MREWKGVKETMKIRLIVLMAVTLLLASSVATAVAVTGRVYGEHITEHALERHFSAEMNPGSHRGFAGFEEHHEH